MEQRLIRYRANQTDSQLYDSPIVLLTHCGRVTHICVGKLIIIGSDKGVLPYRRQTIIWTNAGL